MPHSPVLPADMLNFFFEVGGGRGRGRNLLLSFIGCHAPNLDSWLLRKTKIRPPLGAGSHLAHISWSCIVAAPVAWPLSPGPLGAPLLQGRLPDRHPLLVCLRQGVFCVLWALLKAANKARPRGPLIREMEESALLWT